LRFPERIPEGSAVDEKALKLFSRVSGWTSRGAALRVRHILGSRLRDGARILDVGTGPGVISLQLKRACPRACFAGMDISPGMLELARNHTRTRSLSMDLVGGDGEQVPLKDHSVDILLSLFTLHHMDRPERFLKEAERILKPDGSLLVIDFRRDMPWWLSFSLDLCWQTVFFPTAGRFGFRDSVRSAWRPGEILDRLTESGLREFRVHTNRLELWVTRSRE
jgi:ubiquinone/menaquinone biosynthesis C-methylase UbiE